jgi:cysteine desulfurase
MHTDAVQTVGKVPVSVDDLNVDLLSLSAHKLYGPKGVGALYVRGGTTLHPLLHGGHQERGLRAGTENVPGVVGLAAAAGIAVTEMADESTRLAALTSRLENGLTERIPDIVINGHRDRRLPGTTSIGFRFIEGESVVLALDMEGVAVSTGSACTSEDASPSHVLTAMGVTSQVAQGTVRFGLGRHTAERGVDHVLSVLPKIVERLRAISPLKRNN